MPFYDTDNIQCWFYTAIEEEFEYFQSEDKKEVAEWHQRVLYSQRSLYDECRELIKTHYMPNEYITLLDAIMNSVNWEELLKDLREACVLEA